MTTLSKNNPRIHYDFRIDVQEGSPLLRDATHVRRPTVFPMKAVLAELLGTALLANAVATGTDALHGLTLAALVFSLGHISGAQLNPAVTVAVMVRGKESIMGGVYKAVAQIAGAFLGGLIAMPILDDAVEGSKISAPAVHADVGSFTAVSAEAVWTMVLCLVVLLTATTKSQEGNSHYGLAIGAALTAGVKAIGGITGGALNPALGIALPILKDDGMDSIWIYVVGPLVGGLLAAGAFYLWKNHLN